ncbi:MAG: cytochrome P450 [Candidatus Azotimanducaceae bacterium]|jgi:cytochrome P450
MVMMDRLWGNIIFDPTGEASPHPMIARLRHKGNILRTYMINGWAVVSHEDVKALLRDKRLSSEVFDSALIQRVIRSAAQGLVTPIIDYPNIVNLDAPDHTRLRKLAAQSFTSRFIQSLSPKIDALVAELLDEVAGNDEIEVMDALARPLPAIVIAEMLGVPTDERHYFEQWSADLIKYAELLNADAIHDAVLGDLAMRAYLQELVDIKRAMPGQDLISALIEAEEDGDKLNIEELLSLCTILLVAGHETTTRLISSCLWLLLQHPDQLAEVRSDRALLKNAIEEALRLEPPVLALSRLVPQTFDYKGHTFKKGQLILLSIAGANRDPKVAQDPEAFNIHRDAFEHISFGHGIHLCLGMPLARLEAEVALNQLLDRFPYCTLPEQDLVWSDSPFFRGLERLTLRTTPVENLPPNNQLPN